MIVGHVPREYIHISYRRMQKNGSEMTCTVSGGRRLSDVDGGSLACPNFCGKQKHLKRLITVFARLTMYFVATTVAIFQKMLTVERLHEGKIPMQKMGKRGEGVKEGDSVCSKGGVF